MTPVPPRSAHARLAFEPRSAPPGRRRRRARTPPLGPSMASAPPIEASRAATRAASSRRACRRRRRVTPSDARLIPSERREAGSGARERRRSRRRSPPSVAAPRQPAPSSAGLALTGAGPATPSAVGSLPSTMAAGSVDDHGEGSIVEPFHSADDVDRVLRFDERDPVARLRRAARPARAPSRRRA